jgi:hypothetical protein
MEFIAPMDTVRPYSFSIFPMATPADPHTVESLIAEIVDLCAHIHRAEYRLLTLIRRLDALEGWNAEMPSCAHWLNARCGLDLVTAREKVRVAHALADLPLVDEAFRTGRLSYSKVRAVTRIATAADEAELVEFAASTTAAHVEQHVRARRQAERLADPQAAFDAYRRRRFTCHTEEDGSLVFEGRLPAEQGALLLLALERAMEWVYRESAQEVREAPTAPDREKQRRARCRRTDEHPFKGVPYPARQADALAALAERFLAAPPASEDGLSSADRYQVVSARFRGIVGGARTARPGRPAPHRGRAGGGGGNRTAPDVRLGHRAAHRDRRRRAPRRGPQDPGDLTGAATGGEAPRPALPLPRLHPRAALGGAPLPHWADGGPTNLENVVGVCRFHHRLLHEGGYFVVKDGADFVFCRPDGSMIPPVDASLQQSIARARRNLTVVHLAGAVEEQRAVYWVSRSPPRTADDCQPIRGQLTSQRNVAAVIGRQVDSQLPDVAPERRVPVSTDSQSTEILDHRRAASWWNRSLSLELSQCVQNLDVQQFRRDQLGDLPEQSGFNGFGLEPAQQIDHHRSIGHQNPAHAASRSLRTMAADERFMANAWESLSRSSSSSSLGSTARRSSSSSTQSLKLLPASAAFALTARCTSSGTLRT